VDALAHTPDTCNLLVTGCSTEGMIAGDVMKIAEKGKSILRRYSELNEFLDVKTYFFTSLKSSD
jgi:hypothetical protein